MDISDIGKVANIKRMGGDGQKIREKFSRETKNIIKLKVAQDTAYWDLKEKLHQVEGNHERLQQNMVEVQMQYENISSQYQDELRLRPETLNKAVSGKALAEVVEEYTSRLRGTVSRALSDREALSSAYANASRKVRDLHEQHLQLQRSAMDEAREHSRVIEERAAKAASDMGAAVGQVANLLRERDSDLRQKNEDMILSLQAEVKRQIEELNREKCNVQSVIEKHGLEAMEGSRRADELRSNLRTAEERINMLRNQLAAAEHNRILLQQFLDSAKCDVQEAGATVDRLNRSVSEVNEKNVKLTEIIADKNQIIDEREAYIDQLKEKVVALEKNRGEAEAGLEEVKAEKQAAFAKIDRMTDRVCALEKQLRDIEEEFKNHRVESERMSTTAGDTIARLMRDVQGEADAAHKLEATLHAHRLDAAATQDSLKEDEARQRGRADHLEVTLKNKEKELAEQIKVSQDTKKENERLQDTIRGMQNTIDNIQKELSSRFQLGSSEQDERPERDKHVQFGKKSIIRTSPSRIENEIYSFLSDTSMDSDALHAADVNRRFEALKKRGMGSATEGNAAAMGMKVGTSMRDAHRVQSPILLSQVKNESNTKKRTFFKNKRCESKAKKIK